MLKLALSFCIGYLIGSLLPAYFLGKVLRKTDITRTGERGAGVLKTYQILGIWPSIFTAIFDTSKGLIAAWISSKLNVIYPLCFVASYGAILGHIFPFYLKFRGGFGEATATGVLLFFLFRFLLVKEHFFLAFLILLFFVLTVVYITQLSKISGIFIIPVLWLILLAHSTFLEALIITIPTIHIFAMAIQNILRQGYSLSPKTKDSIKWSRFIARPFAILYIIIYFLTSRRFILYLTGGVAASFLLFDIIRLSKRGINEVIMKTLRFAFKQKEEKTFSSMTHFTVAAFLSFLLFPREIACASILFPVFGDMFAKLMGLEYGRTRLFNKTVEGTLAYIAFSLVAGYLYFRATSFPFLIITLGALSAAISEVLPWELDDNLSGVISSAIIMFFVSKQIL
ncbi:MAG: glycerol-3-phosphate acyltransferase [Candidatus Hydrothermia bacterium]